MRYSASFFIVFALFIPTALFAQDSYKLKILPFDEDAIQERLEDLKNRKSEPLTQEPDSAKKYNTYAMRIKRVDPSDMANMPMMEIRDDIHYTMRIKKYTNYYGKFVNKDSLAQRKQKPLPLKPKD